MPDIGWQELFLIALVTILVVGPKEIPRVLRTVSLWAQKIRGMAREFQSGIDDLAREADLDDFRQELAEAKDFDVGRNIEDMIDPTGEYAKSIQDLENLVESSLEEEPLDDIEDVDAAAAGVERRHGAAQLVLGPHPVDRGRHVQRGVQRHGENACHGQTLAGPGGTVTKVSRNRHAPVSSPPILCAPDTSTGSIPT